MRHQVRVGVAAPDALGRAVARVPELLRQHGGRVAAVVMPHNALARTRSGPAERWSWRALSGERGGVITPPCPEETCAQAVLALEASPAPAMGLGATATPEGAMRNLLGSGWAELGG